MKNLVALVGWRCVLLRPDWPLIEGRCYRAPGKNLFTFCPFWINPGYNVKT
jgi:hypothetical protein